jgi:molybdenum cofactor cytidylyltransferase
VKTAILIMAAGTSSRMGQPKQLLKVGDKTLLQLAVETALATYSSEVICVLGAFKDQITPTLTEYPVTLIDNPRYKHGLSSSIETGLDYLMKLNCDAALIILGDQPNLKAAHINELLNLWRKHPNDIAATAYPNGEGVPAIYPRRYFDALKQLQGDKGAREFLRNNKEEIRTVPHIALSDIDTLQDYENYIKVN